MFHSKVRWCKYMYFFNTERRDYNRKVITELKGSNGKTVASKKEFMNEIQKFYGELYKSCVDDNTNAFHSRYE